MNLRSTTMMGLLCAAGVLAPLQAADVSVIPQPVQVAELSGAPFAVTAETKLTFSAEGAREAAELLAESLRTPTGLELVVGQADAAAAGAVHFELVKMDGLDPEAYQLVVENGGVVIKAGAAAGLINGVQTFRQLLPNEVFAQAKADGVEWSVPAVKIFDEPGYEWRGMMLDVSRYFLTKEYVMRYIDMMAAHKMNVLHWHLIDDCGWRLEIKKYPKLTEIGAWRGEGDQRHGGFYTHEDVREVVEYARKRNVTVVPEIEMPAHTLSALVAYPELGCFGKQFTMPTKHSISPEIYCVGKETTWKFLEDVMAEVAELFPAEYVHIGGDEAKYDRWNQCPDCQGRVKEEGLKNSHELQGWATDRLGEILKKHNKRIIGWAEVLDCGVASDTGIMAWNNPNHVKNGAANGHPVVSSLVRHTYFDTPESKLPGEKPGARWTPPVSLSDAYNWNPTPAGLTKEQEKNILGVNGCIWTDMFLHAPQLTDRPDEGTTRSEAYVDYLSLPRMSALAEVGWTPTDKRDYQDFLERMSSHYLRYQQAGYNFRLPVPSMQVRRMPDGALEVAGSSPIDGGAVHYTLDGSQPDANSPTLDGKVSAPKDAQVKAVTVAADGMTSLVYTFTDQVSKFAKYGTQIGEWKSGQVGDRKPKEVIFDATGLIDRNGTYVVTFLYTGGRQRLDIDGIEIVRNDVDSMGKDIHHGFTGGQAKNNEYTVKVDGYETGASFKVKALIYGDEGSDSNGVVLIRRKED
ncbi:beta-N-acetylhexosaminidase [Sulfuriroseicoccus oceanibius]|uniref:beta-N-acetylhexosaminidase n=1 Tax=Sulfuriroseicoccus oceanibius TaxID=2707525 RepID=A0A6B3LBL4_9BACT|nr:family 20 glycosylhydrolase [Sulfuriroseicoccus oceanibius]QQL46028.1 family 20 glycosylhydrolase [Sulfuriroseicoccus oceanibius]